MGRRRPEDGDVTATWQLDNHLGVKKGLQASLLNGKIWKVKRVKPCTVADMSADFVVRVI